MSWKCFEVYAFSKKAWYDGPYDWGDYLASVLLQGHYTLGRITFECDRIPSQSSIYTHPHNLLRTKIEVQRGPRFPGWRVHTVRGPDEDVVTTLLTLLVDRNANYLFKRLLRQGRNLESAISRTVATYFRKLRVRSGYEPSLLDEHPHQQFADRGQHTIIASRIPLQMTHIYLNFKLP